MKKITTSIIIVLITTSTLFAMAAKEMVSIGPGYGITGTFGEISSTFHGPSIAFTGISQFKEDSPIFIFTDGSIGFPLAVTAGGYKATRNDYELLMSVDMLTGAGYTRSFSNIPLVTNYGIGLYLNSIFSANAFAATTDLMFGLGLYASVQYYLTDNCFVDLSIRPSLTFFNIGSLNQGYGTKWNSSTFMSTNSSGKIGIGYTFK